MRTWSSTSTRPDTDGDGIGNEADPDDDNDGIPDIDDPERLEAMAVDTDGDGLDDAVDPDDDNDGVDDVDDAFPLDAAESVDTDDDGTLLNGGECLAIGLRRTPVLARTETARPARARHAIHLTTAPKDDQGGDAANLSLSGQTLFRLGIELGETELRFEVPRGIGEGRGEHLAGATPLGPTVHDDRNVVVGERLVHVGSGQRQRLTGKQLPAASPAGWCLVEASGRYIVGRLAGGAVDLCLHAHPLGSLVQLCGQPPHCSSRNVCTSGGPPL